MSNTPRNISRPVAASPSVNSSAASSFFIGILAVAGMAASIMKGMWYLAIAVLVLWSALFGYGGGIVAAAIMFGYTLFFFSTDNSFTQFTPQNMQ